MSWLYKNFGIITPNKYKKNPHLKSWFVTRYRFQNILPTEDYLLAPFKLNKRRPEDIIDSMYSIDNKTKINIVNYYLDRIDITNDLDDELLKLITDGMFDPNNIEDEDAIIFNTIDDYDLLIQVLHDRTLLATNFDAIYEYFKSLDEYGAQNINLLYTGIINNINGSWLSEELLLHFATAYGYAYLLDNINIPQLPTVLERIINNYIPKRAMVLNRIIQDESQVISKFINVVSDDTIIDYYQKVLNQMRYINKQS